MQVKKLGPSDHISFAPIDLGEYIKRVVDLVSCNVLTEDEGKKAIRCAMGFPEYEEAV